MPSQSVEAIRLLGRWSRLEQRHLPFGGGCSCGVGMVSIRVKDLEQDLLRVLRSRHPGLPAAENMQEMLRELAKPTAVPAPDFLRELEQSIESFERAHR